MLIEGINFIIGCLISLLISLFFSIILISIFMLIQLISYNVFNINIYKKLKYILFEKY